MGSTADHVVSRTVTCHEPQKQQLQEAKSLSFRWKDVKQQTMKDPSIQHIVEHSNVGDIVSVKAQVISKGQTTIVTSRSTGKEVK